MNAPAWWAWFEQIDKISAQGELIDVGSITVKGEKNVIRTSSMDMGLGFMWVLDEESVKIVNLSRKMTEMGLYKYQSLQMILFLKIAA